MSVEVTAYYDERSRGWAKQFASGNRRIDRQRALVSAAMRRDARQVLIIGCGIGDLAHHIATRVARSAHVRATDISSVAVAIARRLHAHRRVEYQVLDVVTGEVEGQYDVIILPDTYEHIPASLRPTVHERLSRAMAPQSMCILTLPSPGHQRHLERQGEGLQVVDEIVTLDDVQALAKDVGGEVSYFNMVHVWRANDYIHAVIERGAAAEAPLARADRTPLKRAPDAVWRRRLLRATGIRFLTGRFRQWRLGRLLRSVATTD
ncbi:MAG: class I SAM-dependent methyltransferase [Gemmatimonadota bacterium]|nr:class I SAM-dependent methyltransferase [Gemmatimonadota bacterium]